MILHKYLYLKLGFQSLDIVLDLFVLKTDDGKRSTPLQVYHHIDRGLVCQLMSYSYPFPFSYIGFILQQL